MGCASLTADIPRAEALILTTDATDQQTFEAVKAWHACHASSEAAETCLLVVSKMDRLRDSDGAPCSGALGLKRSRTGAATSISRGTHLQYECIFLLLMMSLLIHIH